MAWTRRGFFGAVAAAPLAAMTAPARPTRVGGRIIVIPPGDALANFHEWSDDSAEFFAFTSIHRQIDPMRCGACVSLDLSPFGKSRYVGQIEEVSTQIVGPSCVHASYRCRVLLGYA